jgi:hypothetical protein
MEKEFGKLCVAEMYTALSNFTDENNRDWMYQRGFDTLSGCYYMAGFWLIIIKIRWV